MHAEHRRQHPVADIDLAELFLALLTSEKDSEQIKQKLYSFVLSALIAEMGVRRCQGVLPLVS